MDSVDILIFSLDPDHVFLEGEIIRNIAFVELVDCYAFV